ncbi:MAG: MFS transporter [Planctomycetota bacterium]
MNEPASAAEGQNPKYLTAPVPTSGMPGGVPYIIANEAAERFSFYGMKGILTKFMTHYLFLMGATAGVAMSDAEAKEKFHLFVSAVYFTPFLGAILSDFILGKYRTIILLSIVYCAGHAALAFMGMAGSSEMWLFTGLGLIALGSGGIKPCVSAHVGDQFGKSNSHLLEKVFNFFYLSINAGAVISNLLTPWLLEWYGPHLAFGVPGVLMAIATLLFWMGRKKFVHIPPGGMAFFKEAFSKTGINAILKLSVIYVFVAVFWALFDQTGSSWIIQAEDMNREWLGITWLSAQIQFINPAMILILVPLFTLVVYPAVNKVYTLTPIRKISIGLFVMVGGFGIVALVQEWIDAGQTPSIGWQVAAYAILTASEVMVSITCLEFSYTQAPTKMKSLIMAIFLMSVSLGNLFTAGVNAVIQVPNHLEEAQAVAEEVNKRRLADDALPAAGAIDAPDTVRYAPAEDGSYTLTLAGEDGALGSDDDITVSYSTDGARTDVVAPGLVSVGEASARIEAHYFAQKKLPLEEAGNALLEGMTDPWGKPLQYTLVNSKKYRVSSFGPDQTELTELDRGYVVDVPSLEEGGGEEEADDGRKTWLERRKEELGIVETATDDEGEPTATRTAFIGGQVKLEGASYFWFFTYLMAGTAILFVVVAFLYKPKEYLQEEKPVAGGDLHG